MRFLATASDDKARAIRSYQEHLAIYQRLQEHDLSGAQQMLQKHYQQIRQYYVDKLINRIQL